MSPASFIHSLLQRRLTKLLGNQLEGEVFTELAVQATKGVRVPDVALGSKGYEVDPLLMEGWVRRK